MIYNQLRNKILFSFVSLYLISIVITETIPTIDITSSPSFSRSKQPNLIVTLVDDLGGFNVPWRNPLQKMADGLKDLVMTEGLQLNRFYTFKFCSPSRSSFLSGRFPIHVNEQNPSGVGTKGGIDLRMTILPQKLKQAGYETYITGKWHCGARSKANLPINRGFDHHFGFLSGGEDHYTQRSYETKGKNGTEYVDLWEDKGPAIGRNGTYSCELYGSQAVSWIKQHALKYANNNTPMFMYLPFHDTHSPYEALSRFVDPTVDFESRRTMQAMVSCVAEATTNITNILKQTGMWQNTLFVWAADNGGPQYWAANNYPLRGGKGTDFEGGVRAAAFVTGGVLQPQIRGKTTNASIHLADLHVTLCTMSGLTMAQCDDKASDLVPPMDGIDFPEAFTHINAKRPINTGRGPSKGTTEIVLSDNAYIDVASEWKFVRNTTIVLKKKSGYWTGPVWPVNNSHTPTEADPGCPLPGCLFKLGPNGDDTEHQELSGKYPDIAKTMYNRLEELKKTRFQTTYTGGYDTCRSLDNVAKDNSGFAAPLCVKE